MKGENYIIPHMKKIAELCLFPQHRKANEEGNKTRHDKSRQDKTRYDSLLVSFSAAMILVIYSKANKLFKHGLEFFLFLFYIIILRNF